MSVFRLVAREIRHRKINFALASFSVAVAVACLVGAQSFLQIDQLVTDQILTAKEAELQDAVAEKEAAVDKAGKELEDITRKQMKKLGFNVWILPENQSTSEWHLNGTLSETMPESFVTKLSESKIMTVNHLLPTVARKVHWSEQELDIILYGTKGEVPIMHRALKKPLLDAVPPGTMVLGYNVHQKAGLKKDDKVTLMGKEFSVAKLHPQRGSKDDDSVWIDLAQAQELLGMQNLINAILALECGCSGDRIAQIREEIEGILPGTQALEVASALLVRAESRAKAKQVAQAALKREQESGEAALQAERDGRQQLEEQHATLASVLVPLVVIGCAVWIGVLAFGNVRQRREEIGILRAIGFGSTHILTIFLGKALVIGVLGGLVGVVAGVFIGNGFAGELSSSAGLWGSGELRWTLMLAPVIAPALAALASWLPALMASQQDPAVVLQGE